VIEYGHEFEKDDVLVKTLFSEQDNFIILYEKHNPSQFLRLMIKLNMAIPSIEVKFRYQM
jgi:hypothetical protein